MPRHKKTIEEQYGPREAPPIGVQAQDKRVAAARRFARFTKADEAEQFELIKQNLSQVSFFLSEEVVNIAKGTSTNDIRSIVQLCTALGISYDKLYAKRDMGVRPLSFPEPLLKMVQKGLDLAKNVGSGKAPEVSPALETPSVDSPAEVSVEPTPSIEPVVTGPVVRPRYKSAVMQAAHEALCPDVPVSKTLGVNPRAEYRKAYSEKIKAAQGQQSGGSGLGSSTPEGAGAYPPEHPAL